MRLMGKRQIGEMQPYEFIITLLIAEVACVPMSDISIPLLYGITSIVAIFILHQILSLFEQTSQSCKEILSGKPSIVIDSNGVNCKELCKNNLTVEDLIESMRGTGNFSLENVKYAILESNGKLSIINYPDANDKGDLPILLIDNGKYLPKNLDKLKLNKLAINKFLIKFDLKNEKQVDVMTVSGDGNVYLQPKKQRFITTKMEIKEEVRW